VASYLRSVSKRAMRRPAFWAARPEFGQGSTLKVGAAFATLGRGPRVLFNSCPAYHRAPASNIPPCSAARAAQQSSGVPHDCGGWPQH